jgi:hypothetical protein
LEACEPNRAARCWNWSILGQYCWFFFAISVALFAGRLSMMFPRRKGRSLIVESGRCLCIWERPRGQSPYFDYYGLSSVERISNPDGSFYRDPIFELGRVSLLRIILQPAVWKGWLEDAMIKHGVGLLREDASQMPGVFFLRDRGIVRSFRHRTIADRPDYLLLVA